MASLGTLHHAKSGRIRCLKEVFSLQSAVPAYMVSVLETLAAIKSNSNNDFVHRFAAKFSHLLMERVVFTSLRCQTTS